MKLFVLDQTDLAMAVAELRHLLSLGEYELRGHLLFTDTDSDLYWRLALSKSVHEVLFECPIAEIETVVGAFSWDSQYADSFGLAVHGVSDLERTKELGAMIYDQIEMTGKTPTVNLDAPTSSFHLFFTKGSVIATKQLWQRTEDFGSRTTDKLPAPHPTGMNPKISRALINILAAPKDSVITDPFCGSGGLLIEAALLGYTCIGSDISEAMLKRARPNVAFFVDAGYISKDQITLSESDARAVQTSDYVIADLPYGRRGHISEGKDTLYSGFVSGLHCTKAVLGFGSDQTQLLSKHFTILEHFKLHVHGTLTRHFYVLSKL